MGDVRASSEHVQFQDVATTCYVIHAVEGAVSLYKHTLTVACCSALLPLLPCLLDFLQNITNNYYCGEHACFAGC
jgi:hypothetical protein